VQLKRETSSAKLDHLSSSGQKALVVYFNRAGRREL
jgi:hypothetical protein